MWKNDLGFLMLFLEHFVQTFTITLPEMHELLCHLGVTFLHHFVPIKNLSYFVNEVCNVISKSKVCSELRPNFYQPQVAHVIKATQLLKSFP